MKITSIAVIIIGIFAVIGGAFTSVALHELSHKQDYMGIDKENESLCLFAFPNGINSELGSYSFEARKQESKIEKIDKYTEIKAYAITSIIIFVFVFSLSLVLMRFNELRKIEKSMEIQILEGII